MLTLLWSGEKNQIQRWSHASLSTREHCSKTVTARQAIELYTYILNKEVRIIDSTILIMLCHSQCYHKYSTFHIKHVITFVKSCWEAKLQQQNRFCKNKRKCCNEWIYESIAVRVIFLLFVCVLFLRGSGTLDSDHTHHVPARLLEDLAEGAENLLLDGSFLLRVVHRGLHRLPVYCHPKKRV